MGFIHLKLGNGEHLLFETYPITPLILTISLSILKTIGVQNTCLNTCIISPKVNELLIERRTLKVKLLQKHYIYLLRVFKF